MWLQSFNDFILKLDTSHHITCSHNMGILISLFSSIKLDIKRWCYWDSTRYLKFSIRRRESPHCDMYRLGIQRIYWLLSFVKVFISFRYQKIWLFSSPSRKKSEYWNMKLLWWGEGREEWGKMVVSAVMLVLVVAGVVPSMASQEEWSLSGLYRNPNTSIFLTGDNICTKRETWVLRFTYH